VLPYLEVPRDVPLNPRLIQAAYKHQDAVEESSLEDFTAADFSAQTEDLKIDTAPSKAAEPKPRSAEVMMGADEGSDITVPDFSGKTMREVTEMCLRLGLDPVLVGSNLATDQTPAEGSTVKRGARVTVQFGTPLPQKPVSSAKPRKSSRH
jgi:beta-lactam-binding protein with PASTA domain